MDAFKNLSYIILGFITILISGITLIKDGAYFFYLTLLIGIGLLLYGIYKNRKLKKQAEDFLEQKKAEWGQREFQQMYQQHNPSQQAQSHVQPGNVGHGLRQQDPDSLQQHYLKRQSVQHSAHHQAASEAPYHPEAQPSSNHAAMEQNQHQHNPSQHLQQQHNPSQQLHSPKWPQRSQKEWPESHFSKPYKKPTLSSPGSDNIISQKQFCPQCGSAVQPYFRFCARCGSQL